MKYVFGIIFMFNLSCTHYLKNDVNSEMTMTNILRYTEKISSVSATDFKKEEALVLKNRKIHELQAEEKLKLAIIRMWADNQDSNSVNSLLKEVSSSRAVDTQTKSVARLVYALNQKMIEQKKRYQNNLFVAEKARRELENKIKAITKIEKSIEKRARDTMPLHNENRLEN